MRFEFLILFLKMQKGLLAFSSVNGEIQKHETLLQLSVQYIH